MSLEWQKVELWGVELVPGGKNYKEAQEDYWEWCGW